jgi:hypothetical protein
MNNNRVTNVTYGSDKLNDDKQDSWYFYVSSAEIWPQNGDSNWHTRLNKNRKPQTFGHYNQ